MTALTLFNRALLNRTRFNRTSFKIDRVWLTIALIVAASFAVSIDRGTATVGFAARAFLDILPFLAFAVAAAAYAKASGADNLVARAFSGHMAMMIAAGALVGALSPFCSCGVIPLIAALLAVGTPLAPVMAFWLASPIMDPEMFVLTAGVLGTGFAVAKTAAAIGVGLLGGTAVYAVQRLGGLAEPLRPEIGNGGCGGSIVRAPKEIEWRIWHEKARRAKFLAETRKTGLFLGKWMILAFLLESLMLAYVPQEWIVTAVGGDGAWPVIVAALVGVPAYLNGLAALPLVGGLMDQGMSAGAAMAFLVGGGISSIPAALAVWAVAKKPLFATYLGLAITGAVISGLIYGLIA